jgi:hypothetical protein
VCAAALKQITHVLLQECSVVLINMPLYISCIFPIPCWLHLIEVEGNSASMLRIVRLSVEVQLLACSTLATEV